MFLKTPAAAGREAGMTSFWTWQTIHNQRVKVVHPAGRPLVLDVEFRRAAAAIRVNAAGMVETSWPGGCDPAGLNSDKRSGMFGAPQRPLSVRAESEHAPS